MSGESAIADGRNGKRKMRPGLKLLLLIVVPVLALVIGWMALDIATRWKLDAVIADIRARGWPTELADLYSAPIPDSENAATVYRHASGKLKEFTEVVKAEVSDGTGGRWWGTVRTLAEWETLTEEQREALRAWVSANQEALALLHQAAQMEQCQFDLKYKDGFMMLLPHLAKLRSSSRLECAAVIIGLAESRSDEAMEHWLDSVALVRHQEGQRILISELVRLACLSISLDALQALVQRGQLTEPQLARALSSLENVEARDSFADGLKGELAFTRDAFARWAKGDAELERSVSSGLLGGGTGSGPRRRPWLLELFADLVGGWRRGSEPIDSRVRLYGLSIGRPLRQSDEETCLRLYTELIQLGEQRYYKLPQQLERWGQKVKDLSWHTAFLSKKVLGSVGASLQALARGEAKATAARTALAVERYRLAHGDYPDTLDALAPDILPQVPLDPFDGKPLRYINDGKRVIVYSVGENLQDDGGSEEEVGSPHRPKDIVFTLRGAAAKEGGEGQQP